MKRTVLLNPDMAMLHMAALLTGKGRRKQTHRVEVTPKPMTEQQAWNAEVDKRKAEKKRSKP